MPVGFSAGRVRRANGDAGLVVRGFGMCEMQWGIERQMDEVAKELNMDPLEIRLINGMKDG
ncbi:MAG: molybdopterin cofactor-binding domain-containing protein, partial [Planctomycetota bacterium]|nr:molybdopterin cofactor-binding domain-containing protein [Planctomycetota bacterium]